MVNIFGVLDKYRHFIVIFCLWFALWGALFWVEYSRGNINAGILTSDSLEYYASAVNLYDHGVFSRMTEPPFIPDRFRTPFYPLVAGAILWVFNGIAAVYIFQFFLSFISAIGVYLIADFLWNSKQIAFIAALAFVFNPVTFLLVNSFMSETLFLLLLIFGAYYFLLHIKSGSTGHFAVSIAFFSLNALVRPAVLYFVFFAFLYSVLTRFNPRKLIVNTAVFAAIFLIILFPWFLRNRIIFNDWHFTSADLINTYYMHLGQLYGWQNGLELHDAIKELGKFCAPSEVREDFHGWCVSPQLRELYLPVLSQISPSVIFKYVSLGGVRYLFNGGFMEFGNWLCEHKCSKAPLNIIDVLANGGSNVLSIIKNKPPVLLFTWIVDKVVWFVVYFLAGFSLWNWKKFRADGKLLVFILLVLGYFLAISIPAWTTRYRVPFDPFLFLLAAPGFWYLKNHLFYVRDKRI